jgi:hypothetical protein
MPRFVVVLIVLIAHVQLAAADSPFAVLTNPKAVWHYDIVRGKKHKPSPVKATIAVTAIHTAGAYTAIEFETTLIPDEQDSPFFLPQGTWIIGPEGLREILYFANHADGHADTEEYLATQYKEHYVPRTFLQPKPAVAKKLRWSFLRFGDEDREYHVTGSISKPNPHTWRTTWKGYYTIPENGEKDPFTWMTEFDPAVGFTQICTEADFCFRLAAP